MALLLVARELEFFAVRPLPLAGGLAAQGLGTLLGLRAFSVPGK
jgi:hypothetical protein